MNYEIVKPVCPYCGKFVLPSDPDRMVVFQSAIDVHGKCFKEAIENVKNRVYVPPVSVPKSQA